MDFKLHHIGILVKDLKTASDQYMTTFGYALKSQVIHDPIQTAYVQFLSLQNNYPILELITPDGPVSKLSHQLKKGGGLNHLCYETDTIEESCKILEEKRMFILQNPVFAAAFPGRRIAWLMGKDGIPIELVEKGIDEWKIQ